ncbi:MAG: RDD family protein [Nitrospiraceae bacterium]|nr:RDD family protein [Nitrospiraceae bacterium]
MSEEQKRAGLLLRTAAKIVDFILIAAVIEIIPRAGFYAGLMYLLLGDGFFDGRSVGKKLLRLKVLSAETGGPCSFKDSILRNCTFGVGYALWIVPFIGWIFIVMVSVVEFLLVLGSKDGMRLGDEIAKTVVIETL